MLNQILYEDSVGKTILAIKNITDKESGYYPVDSLIILFTDETYIYIVPEVEKDCDEIISVTIEEVASISDEHFKTVKDIYKEHKLKTKHGMTLEQLKKLAEEYL